MAEEEELQSDRESSSTNDDVPKENERCTTHEKFEEVDGGAALSDDGLFAKYCFRALSKYPIIYGYKRYSYGTHRVHFQIDKRGDLRSFFGITASSDRVSRVIATEFDNKSLYGWWGLNTIVVNGKLQRNKEKNDIEKHDELTLIIRCDEQQIQLYHHRTKRLLQLSIDVSLCSFPWKVIVELPMYGECVRILPSSHY